MSYPYTLTLPQRDCIRWHLLPEVRLPKQAALAFEPPEPTTDLMRVMDLQQEQIARALGEGHRVIHGAAGAGKTMILISRARRGTKARRHDSPWTGHVRQSLARVTQRLSASSAPSAP